MQRFVFVLLAVAATNIPYALAKSTTVASHGIDKDGNAHAGKQIRRNKKSIESKRMLDTSKSACGSKSSEETTLIETLANLEDQLSTNKDQLDEATTDYALSRDTYYNKASIVNTKFSQVVQAEQGLDLVGNNIISLLIDNENNGSLSRLHESYDLFLIQKQAYREKLEEGAAHAEIKQAKTVLDATSLELKELMTLLSGTYDGLHVHATLSLKEYSSSIGAVDSASQTYEATLLELSQAKSDRKAYQAKAASTWDSFSEVRKQWRNTMDSLQAARRANLEACLSGTTAGLTSLSPSRKLLSQSNSQRRTQADCDCSEQELDVDALEKEISDKENDVSQAEQSLDNLTILLQEAEQTEEDAEIAYIQAETALEEDIDVDVALQEVEDAIDSLNAAQVALTVSLASVDPTNVAAFSAVLAVALQNINDAQKALQDALASLEAAQQAREDAEDLRDQLKLAWDQSITNVEDLESQIDQTRLDLGDCEDDLKALNTELSDANAALSQCEINKNENCQILPPVPGGQDDPHLWTWKGLRYNYHGQCDLIYTTCPSFDGGKGLDLHLRTEFVLPSKWSTISSLAVQLGEDVFEVQNNGTYYLNKERYEVDSTDETTILSGHKLNYRTEDKPNVTSSIFTLDLTDDVSLEMTRKVIYGRNSASFKIIGVHDHRMRGGDSFSDCVGLSSTWDHPDEGDFLIGRTGETYRPREAVDFGPEWQVDLTKEDPLLFVENIGQHLPYQRCVDSPLQTKDQRHLKKLHEADGGALARQAEEACSHLDGSDLFDACFFDVLVTGDVTFALDPLYTEGV